MPIGKYFGYVGSALLALLFVFDACFGDKANARFDASLFENATYAPRFEEVAATKELRFARDIRPARRVKEVFAQFVPGEGKSGKRHSSATAFIR